MMKARTERIVKWRPTGHISFAIFCLFLCTCTAGAQKKNRPATGCTSVVDTSVWKIVSSGTWRDGKRYGGYRVLLLKHGLEHALHSIEVQILEWGLDPGSDHPKKILRKCITIDSPGRKGHVQDIRIKPLGERAAAIELDVEMRAMDGIVLKEVFLVKPSGESHRITEAKYVDIHDYL